MEKDPSKNHDPSLSETKWDEMADFERKIKAFREAQKAATKSSVSEAEKAEAKELELAKAREAELAEANVKETAPATARELETAEAKEQEVQKNIEELEDTYKELLELETRENIEQYEDTLRELWELDNAKNIQDYREVSRELKEIEDEIRREERAAKNPLVAINADWTHDKKIMAHDLAEQTLNAEVAKGNIISKIWKGTLFKKYYEKKYEKEFLSEKRTNKDGKTLTDLIEEESPAVMERFVLSAVEDESRYVHTASGEKLVPADKKTNDAIRHAIEKYARTSLKKGEKVSDLDRLFENDINRIMHEAVEDGHISTNYLEVAREAARRYQEVAINAKSKAEHDKAMSEVMAGFQAYNADVRSGVRTEAHRDNIDKIVNAIESSKIGQFIPTEILAGAAGAAIALTQTGARAIAGAAGGIFASSIISGLKERNRITEDRARMLRDIASGKDYDSKSKKVAKHEQRIGGTLYDMEKASDLTNNLYSAMYPKSGKVDQKALLSAIAEARVRIDFSDAERKDLISYSSDKDRGRERLDLDIAVIEAERMLSGADREKLDVIKEHLEDEIYESVDKKDKKFKNYRTLAAMKKAGKTLALGSAIFLGSQEIMAAIDPAKIGIFEKAGLLKTENTTDAKETLLASGFGQFRGSYEIPGSPKKLEINDISKADAIKKYEANGFTKIQTKDVWTETKSTLTEVDPSVSTARIDVKYDGWASDGGITMNMENGRITSILKGAATIKGQRVDLDPHQVKAFITIGDSKFEIAGSLDNAGQLSWGEGGVFTTTTGETIKAIGDNGEKLYKYFEVAIDNGVENGVHHITPLATDVGRNAFSGKIEQVVEELVEHPAVYSFVKEIPGTPETLVRGITANGFAFAPELARTGLGEAVSSESSTSSESPTEAESISRSPEEVPQEPTLVSPVEIPAEEELSAREILDSVPEENIETMPNVEEVTTPTETVTSTTATEAPTAEETSTAEESPDFTAWESNLRSEIENARDLIGEDGVAALTESNHLTDEMQANFRRWWSGLSKDGKDFVRNLENRIFSSEYAYSPNLHWGNSFNTWFALNSRREDAEVSEQELSDVLPPGVTISS